MTQTFRDLLQTFPRPGVVRWIGLRTAHRGAVQVVERVFADAAGGLVGDRWRGSPGGCRQVTLIQAEHLGVIAQLLGRQAIEPQLLRRNIVVAEINLHALRRGLFRIGEAILRGTGDCDPCSRMEENLGPGGYQAMRGHGGITATIVQSGWIGVGDPVVPVASPGPTPEHGDGSTPGATTD